MRTSMIPATASSAIVRKSHASASSNAPPSAAPWIWQIVGFGISSSRFHQASSGAAEGAQAGWVLGQVAQVVQVHPGREHGALAAHHEHAHVGVGGRGLDGGAELRDQLAVERVALLGPVEDEVADRAAILCSDQ